MKELPVAISPGGFTYISDGSNYALVMKETECRLVAYFASNAHLLEAYTQSINQAMQPNIENAYIKSETFIKVDPNKLLQQWELAKNLTLTCRLGTASTRVL